MKLLVTIDVEEGGLFSGVYSRSESSASNVFHLDVLDSVFLEPDVRPTLLVSYQVANKEKALEKILRLKDRWKAEIGAHLHHWNTPPIVSDAIRQPTPSESISTDLLEAKTDSLFESLSKGGQKPTSFRMGRFNLGPKMFQILERKGIKVDSSISPLRRSYGGANHLAAPSDPYFPNPNAPDKKGNSVALEAPITILPVFRSLGKRLDRLAASRSVPEGITGWLAMNIGSIAVQPAWVNMNLVKLGVKLHSSRGGECLTIFFHSSELSSGMSPLNPTREAVNNFVKNLGAFIRWSRERYHAESLTLSELYPIYESQLITT